MLYHVKIGETERLVEASHQAVARNFAARELISVERVKPDDLYRLAREGVEIEVATGGDAAEPAPPETEPQPETPQESNAGKAGKAKE